MNKEELIKISRENLRKSKQGSLCECYDEAFIKGYELSKKRILELEQQIEKMKCCEICMYKGFGRNFEFRCSIQGHIIKNPFEEKCDKWEIEK